MPPRRSLRQFHDRGHVPAEFQRTCAPPEEEPLVDSYFDKGDGEAVEYENVDEPVQLDAGDVGER